MLSKTNPNGVRRSKAEHYNYWLTVKYLGTAFLVVRKLLVDVDFVVLYYAV